MILAAIGDGAYNVVYLLHIVSVLLGAGGAFLLPLLTARARSSRAAVEAVQDAMSQVLAPALFAAGIFGGALVGLSDDVYDFGQVWLAISGPVWIVAVVAAALANRPSFLVSRLPSPGHRRPMFTGVMHLSLAVLLVLMIWRPGA